MTNTGLDDLTLTDFKQLQKDVAIAISCCGGRKKAEALSASEAKAQETGFSLANLIGLRYGHPMIKKATPPVRSAI